MKRTARIGAAAAMLMLGAHPCLAADLYDDRHGERRTAAFAGASVKLGLGGRRAAKPEARLQLGVRYNFQSSSAATRPIALLELGVGKTGKPAFYMAGRDIGQTQHQLGVKTGTVLLVAGGVLLTVVAVGALALSDGVLEDGWLCPKEGPCTWG